MRTATQRPRNAGINACATPTRPPLDGRATVAQHTPYNPHSVAPPFGGRRTPEIFYFDDGEVRGFFVLRAGHDEALGPFSRVIAERVATIMEALDDRGPAATGPTNQGAIDHGTRASVEGIRGSL